MPPEPDAAFARALATETLESERLRARALALVLSAILLIELVLFAFAREHVEHLTGRVVSRWLPVYVLGPFVAYECLVLFVLSRFAARGRQPPVAARMVNATIETSLPTVLLGVINEIANAEVAFSTWPPLLYFLFILVATLRLNFLLPLFTGAVAAIQYFALAAYLLPLAADAHEPVHTYFFHGSKAALMLIAGILAGAIAVRLRRKFEHAAQEAAARERVTSVFGQHVSPAVVERLLDRRDSEAGELREVCVMFLDIRDFTAAARQRAPDDVVAYLNGVFAFMIEAIDRHNGIINKFLGDGFMAVFGAPLDDPRATVNAVAAARDILGEIDRRGLGGGVWPLRVGIGLHAGTAITGSVGSPRRKEFTVIGDTVNFASRLEQLTKEHGARLLVSGAVAAALKENGEKAALLGVVPVRGYAEPMEVWRLA